MTEGELVELVAKAMFESFQDTQDNHLRRDTWDSQIGRGLQPYYREAAKAAIKVIASHDPTR